MEMMVVIPIEAYRAMVERCDPSRAEYALLKNGVVARSTSGEERIEILCSTEQAKQIVDFAATDCPELSPLISFVSPARPDSV
jgi:hypothetical protein